MLVINEPDIRGSLQIPIGTYVKKLNQEKYGTLRRNRKCERVIHWDNGKIATVSPKTSFVVIKEREQC
ncbi:hypothetical protein VXS06_14535 [Photobacterium toruni]|uniref:Uncharacterized protein n=1 Tax=Photobacterium toruni TaxID=1935446 RepID=A0ABU6L9J1_9GAMM|nr:hypothetical protein [Photobacterium toruni]